MKGKLFVCLYSIILIGIFGTFCYLMTIVNPPRLPMNGTRRLRVDNDMYPRAPLLPRNNPDYGLEKIPEGVDADEFRKQLKPKYHKYDLEIDKSLWDTGKRVVPPIWPSDNVAEKNIVKERNKGSNYKEFHTFSPVKGHRRSVDDNQHIDIKDGPGSILLKIVDDNGHKKIEIKFISGENITTKKLRRNRSPIPQLKSNATHKEMTKVYRSAHNKDYDDINNEIIHIKSNDIVLVNADDESHLFIESVIDGNNTNNMQNLLMNVTDLNYFNKTQNNETNKVNVQETENKLREIVNNDLYTFNFIFNEENSTIYPRSISNKEHNSDPLKFSKTLKYLNNTSSPTESMLLLRST